VIFGVVGSPAEGKAFYADIKARITPCGRDPDHLKILPAAFVVVGETMAEVEASRERLDATSKSRMAGGKRGSEASGRHNRPRHDGQAFARQRGKVNGILADSYVVEIPGVIDAHNNVANLPAATGRRGSRGVRSIGSCPPRSRHLGRIHEALPSGWHVRSRNREQNGRSRVLIVCRNQ
jgi:hypothetical protein